MERIVHVHHVDKDAYLKGNIEPDPEEVDLVFDLSPSFAEVVAQVRVELNWNEPNDGVELEGRHNVGFGMHTRWKTMRINSEQRWSVYKETVAGSQDKALELFATKTVDARIELDLNRPSSPVRERSPPPMSQEEATQSPIVQSPIAQQPPLDNEYDEHDDGDDGFEMNGNNIGDLDKYWTQEEMDHSIPYSRCYASDSDDDGPEEEVDEDGLTAKEAERAEIFKKVTGRDIRVPLFRDVSLADGAVVDGGKSFLLGARPISKRDVDATTAMISKGLTFDTFLELKIWLKEFSIKHHRPYIVVHSDLKKRYTLKCVDKSLMARMRSRTTVNSHPSSLHTSYSKRLASQLIVDHAIVRATIKGSAHLAKNQRAMMLAQVKHQVANKLQINLEANKPQANKPQANKVQANRLHVNLLQANKLQAHKPHGNKLHGKKLQAHKPHGNKLQRNKLQLNKLQGNKPHGNKLVRNKLQGNKPQGIQHNGDKVQGFKLGLVEVGMVAVGVLA
ncbi:hypothetical protein QYE76_034851 [Lolium multiflorum]|uniref:Uncharacterized protein n=1 Tax=Lolium multiflorum TaxID=4521 RepID=A0AAD8VNP4_LOLMU|nr:hypothetical protein QYE76_034851 [Lolium multiflorum]